MTERKAKQLTLEVRLYRVRCDGWVETEVQAASASAAKYQVFKKAREAGYFCSRDGFREFLSRGFLAHPVLR